MANVNLYHFPQVVQLSQPGSISSASVMNRSDFSFFKNVDNDVEFLIKTYDNKPIDLTNKTLTIYIVDDRDNQLVVQKALDSSNPNMAKRGHARLTLSWAEIADLTPGYFFYSVSVTDSTGKEILLYTDLSRTIQGYCELQQGPLPGPQSAYTLSSESFTPQSWGPDVSISSYYVAGPYPGAAQRGNVNGIHHIAIYATNFSGTVWVNASLENAPPTDDSQWFDIALNPTGQTSYEFTNFSGIKHFSFVGSYMWIQFTLHYVPINEGEVTQILYKN
jgi:hypothetical protein